MNKARGGDGINNSSTVISNPKRRCFESASLNMPANWKTQHWPQDWKSQFSFQSQRKAMPKNSQTIALMTAIALI